MIPVPAVRRPLERVALTLAAKGSSPVEATPRATVVGVASVIDADDLEGRAVELSRLLALHNGSPTLLVEANVRRPSRLAAAMEMDPGPGLLDAMRAADRAEEGVRPTPDPRLWVMTAGANAPTHSPLGLADFTDVVSRLREGTWAVPRRVLDIRSDHDDLDDLGPGRERAPALVSVGGAEETAEEESGTDLRPFNEGRPDPGVPAASDLPPLPPLVATGGPGGRRPSGKARTPTIVIVAPPFDHGSDADVVASPCDQLILLVHAGRTSREEVADAAARLGSDKLVGTVVVRPRGRRARST